MCAVKITVVNITLYPDTVTRDGNGGRVHPVRGVRGGGRPHARRQLLRSHPQHHQVNTLVLVRVDIDKLP